MPQRKTSKKVDSDLPGAPRSEFYQTIVNVLLNARANIYRAVNFIMVEAYWNVGRMIMEEEQLGKERAEYGTFLIRNLAIKLTNELGKGFDERELRRMRQFYIAYPIRGSLRPELKWTHYRLLLRVENEQARAWYLTEAAEQNWSTRALERQINSLYYERLLISRDKSTVFDEMREKTAPLVPAAQDFIKDPYVLEFLGLLTITGTNTGVGPS